MKTRVLAVFAVLFLCLLLFASPVSAYIFKPIDKMTPKMDGLQETPPNNSLATGLATFQDSTDGTAMHFRLTVNNLSNITAAHIHLAPPGVPGPIIVNLYTGPQISGPFSGVLAEGDITASDLVGPLIGQPLLALDTQMNNGQTYVNVHTILHPGGEIRGQVELVSPVPGLSNTGVILMAAAFSLVILLVIWRKTAAAKI